MGAARVLHSGGVVAAGVVVSVAICAAVLVPLGAWRPLIALPLIVVVLAALMIALRPALRPPRGPRCETPAWTAAACVAVAAGQGVWAAATHAEHVVLRRDAGSYALFAQWIATRHGLPVEAHVEAFGGAAALADPGFRVSSPAFFQVVSGEGAAASVDVVPQFLLGAPAWFSLGWWAAGWSGLLVAPAVASGLAILAVAGLAARLLGPRWAMLATLAVAGVLSVLLVARSTYSEPLALLLVAAAASLLVDAVRSEDRRVALLAGAAFGLAGLIRVDAVREVALLLPVAAALAIRRHPAAGPLAAGAIGGLLVSSVPALLLSRPYLGEVAGSLLPLLAGTALLGLLSVATVLIHRRRFRDDPATKASTDPDRDAPAEKLCSESSSASPDADSRSPDADSLSLQSLVSTSSASARIAGAAVLGVGLLLASRPLWTTTRQDPKDPGSRVVAGLQLRQGLPIDGGRTYAEHSVQWVSWYLGPITVAAAWLTFAVLAARAVTWWQGRGRPPGWLGPAVIGFGSMVLTFARPGITPDHPWADRRLVPVVLPALVLAGVAALAWAVRRLAARGSGWQRAGIAAGIVTLLLPIGWATAPLAGARTEQGELRAVRRVCAALRPDDVVIAVDARGANEWPQAVRGVCDHPSASLRLRGGEPQAQVIDALDRIAERAALTGHRPVLLAAEPRGQELLVAAGLSPVKVVEIDSREDQRWLTQRPDGTAPLDVDVWLAPWMGRPAP